MAEAGRASLMLKDLSHPRGDEVYKNIIFLNKLKANLQSAGWLSYF